MVSNVLQRLVILVMGIAIGAFIATSTLSGVPEVPTPPRTPAPPTLSGSATSAATTAPATAEPAPACTLPHPTTPAPLELPLSMTSSEYKPHAKIIGDNGCPLGMNTDDMLGHTEHTLKRILADVPTTVRARTTMYRDRRQKIPYRIMQNNKLDQVPIGMWHAMHSVVALNPDYDYEYYSDERMRSFIVVNMDRRTLEAFDTLVPGAFKSDLFRYCWLWVRGGVYIDSDMTAVQPLSKLIPYMADFVSPEDNNNGFLYNAFLATTPRHPVIGAAITLSVKRILAHWYGHVLSITGPVLLGEAFEEIVQDRPKKLTSYLNSSIRINNYERRGDCGAGFVNDGDVVGFITAYPTYRSEMSWYHAGTKQYWDYVYTRTAYVDNTKLIDSCPFGLKVGMIASGVVPMFNGLDATSALHDVASLVPARTSPRDGSASRAIPLKLMVMAPLAQVPPGVRESINDLLFLNPDHSVELFSERTARDYVRLNCPDAAGAFDGLRPVLMKLDVFKYCWLSVSGGVAVSPYATFFTNFSFIAAKDQLVYAKDAAIDLPSDVLLGAVRGHPAIQKALELVVKRVRAQDYGVEVGHVVGRNLLKDALEAVGSLASVNVLSFTKADHCVAGVLKDSDGKSLLFNTYDLAQTELPWYLPVPTPKDAYAARTVFSTNQTLTA